MGMVINEDVVDVNEDVVTIVDRRPNGVDPVTLYVSIQGGRHCRLRNDSSTMPNPELRARMGLIWDRMAAASSVHLQ